MHQARQDLDIRKRVHKKYEQFPHPKKFIRVVDSSVVVVGIISQIFTIPQITIIWINKDAADLSIITWVTWFLYVLVLLLYGVVHKSRSIIITYVLWVLLYIPIIIGIILYG
mgnify:CR=1 FL=1|tara:strand:+ start:1377 stop:1712 length:336 start_codon:yes stop_codon:yes gene_type:complete